MKRQGIKNKDVLLIVKHISSSERDCFFFLYLSIFHSSFYFNSVDKYCAGCYNTYISNLRGLLNSAFDYARLRPACFSVLRVEIAGNVNNNLQKSILRRKI